MHKFYETYKKFVFVQLPVAQIPWRSNIVLLDSVNDTELRILFAKKVLEEGWSKNILLNKIGNIENARSIGNKNVNYEKHLPVSDDQRKEIFKDPLILSFINSSDFKNERHLENIMADNVTELLLNFAKGFMLLGKQFRVEVGTKEYFIDLLFYNRKLKRHLVIELKTGEFEPNHTSQLTFYMTIVDEYVKEKNDYESIGLLLVRKKDKLVAELALRDVNKPIGVGEYLFKDELPKYLEDNLPTLNEIKSRLENK